MTETNPQQRPTVLVADDDESVREFVAELLSLDGFEPVTAVDGGEVLPLALVHRPALVILDLAMPGMDGYATLARLRAEAATRDVPVIVMTGRADPGLPALSAGLGAMAHVTKPFAPAALSETVRRVLADHAAAEARRQRMGDRLVARGLVSAEALAECILAERQEGRPLEAILLARGLVATEALAEAQTEARQAGDVPGPPPPAGPPLTAAVRRAAPPLPALDALAGADASGVAQVYALLLAGVREGATELHVEPLAHHVRVRHRQHGRLVERARLPGSLLDPVVARLRVLAGIGDEDPPQVAYLRTRLDGQEVELELAFAGSPHGEAVTVRLWREGLVDPEPILGAAIDQNASDIYLLEAVPPVLKVDGVARPLPGARPLTDADLRKLVIHFVPPEPRARYAATGEADLSMVHPQYGRFRLNCYRAIGARGMVLRRVKTEVPTFASLDLPPLLGQLAMERQGLILLVGATGSGKSTTLAAMIDHRNEHAPGHIVTIEDPVEFIHTRKQSVVSQREVGVDTASYLVALQQALRQAPDVILVGEMRDSATVSIALHSAETGHLVLSTLHATNAAGAVERLLNFFPPEARDAVLMQLSLSLRAVVVQRLVPRAGGSGRVAAIEIMLSTPRIQAIVRRGELDALRIAIEEGVNEGLQTMDQALLALYQGQQISQDDALRFADSPNNLRLRLKGIR